MMKQYQFWTKNEQHLIKIVICETREANFVIKLVCKSINRDTHVTGKVIFVNFVPVIWKMMKIRCIDPLQYPSLLIENEKSMIGKVHPF